MSLHTETISENMLAIAECVRTNFDSFWYLAGGTALALQIGHRASVDLDYFTPKRFDTDALRTSIQSIFENRHLSVDYEAPHTLWCTIDGIKVSFISREVPLLQPPIVLNQFVLASMSDITVMKLLAVCSREEYKDYVDLACLSCETDVRSWPLWWKDVYPGQDLTSWLVALSAVDSILEIPLVLRDSYVIPPVVGTIKHVVTDLTEYLQKVAVG